jgi:hypothetical protein
MDTLFLRMRIDLLCDDCRRQKLDPTLCNHNDHKHPPWLSGANANRVKVLMGDDPDMYCREVYYNTVCIAYIEKSVSLSRVFLTIYCMHIPF